MNPLHMPAFGSRAAEFEQAPYKWLSDQLHGQQKQNNAWGVLRYCITTAFANGLKATCRTLSQSQLAQTQVSKTCIAFAGQQKLCMFC